MGERRWTPLILLLVRCAAVLPEAADNLSEEDEALLNCTDLKQQPVAHGEKYIPRGYDPCTTCTCYRGRAEMCVSTLCSPPRGCYVRPDSSDKCCDIVCRIQPSIVHPGEEDHGMDHGIRPHVNVTAVDPKDVDGLNTTNLGLRLVASTVTSFLILALLLFMIHRLRQRRLLLMIRRLNGRQGASGTYGSRRFSLDDDASVGYFAGVDRIDLNGPYEDPPPPYPFWKPPDTYFPHGEAPPPYEVLAPGGGGVAASRVVSGTNTTSNVNNNLNANNNNNNNHHAPTPTTFPFVYTNFRSSLYQVALHAHNFQMNNLDRENPDSETTTGGNPALGGVPVVERVAAPSEVPVSLNLNVVGSVSSLSSQSEQNDLLAIRSDAVYEDVGDHAVPGAVGEVPRAPKRWHDETSSSSSQTYEPRTASPSSSDSSSGDFGFQVAMPSSGGNIMDSARNTRQSNSLDRTLGRIKRRFSLARRRSGPATAGCVPVPRDTEVPPQAVPPTKPLPGPSHAPPAAVAAPPVVPRRAPRISYVSDDDLAVRRSIIRPIAQHSTRRHQDAPAGRRPRSYDFGDLRAPIREESSSASGTVTTQTRTDGFRSSSSLDSLLCTCSSRASFGSLVGSGSGAVREGPASPSSSCGPLGTDTLSGSFPASPDEEPVALAEPEAPALPPRGARVAVAVPLSRSGSVCSETGERNPRGGNNESYI